jgi:hypothetical protein
LDYFQNRDFILLGKIHIPPQLNIHPQIGRHVEKLCQPQSGAGSDPPAPIDNVVDAFIGNVDGIGFYKAVRGGR